VPGLDVGKSDYQGDALTASTLNEILRDVAAAHPGRVAFETPTHRWTFAEIDEGARRTAEGLRALGIGPGDRVACLTKHTAHCVVLTFAACRVGAVCMPVNWRLAAPEVEFIVNDGHARFLMVDAAFLATIAKTTLPSVGMTVLTEDVQLAPSATPTFAAWRGGFAAAKECRAAHPGETALQLYSSGTTGLPKGVELTHANLFSLIAGNSEAFRYDGERSVLLNALPTFHIAGIGLAVLTVSQAGKTVLYPDFEPVRLINGMAEHGITHLFLVPAMILALLNAPGVEAADYRSLEVMAYGASPISEKVLVEAMRVFRCNFLQVYGLTETCGSVTYLPPEDHDPNGPRAGLLRSAGRAGLGVRLRVVDPASGSDVADGEVGEIWIHYSGNMKGYWNNPAGTLASFPEGRADGIGWFRGGDAGFMRAGYLYIHDRIKDMIVSGGENIYPAEVENALMKHPAVADCAVIGVPDEQWGESVKACIVLKAGGSATEAEVIAFCREQIAHFKSPKTVEFRDALPRNPSGKLLKFQLREPYWRGRERLVN
jgi:acyl-CoA synthetase (AMP-forming)/AMP-acid ligase II